MTLPNFTKNRLGAVGPQPHIPTTEIRPRSARQTCDPRRLRRSDRWKRLAAMQAGPGAEKLWVASWLLCSVPARYSSRRWPMLHMAEAVVVASLAVAVDFTAAALVGSMGADFTAAGFMLAGSTMASGVSAVGSAAGLVGFTRRTGGITATPTTTTATIRITATITASLTITTASPTRRRPGIIAPIPPAITRT